MSPVARLRRVEQLIAFPCWLTGTEYDALVREAEGYKLSVGRHATGD